MYLNKNISTKIIEGISPYIRHDINIIDTDGVVIASTNKHREKTIHEGGRILLNENLEELIIESDEMYAGCKKGVNLPLFFDDQVLGVIGITGEPSKIIDYGRIVKKMAEMLIQAYYEGIKKNSEEQKKLLIATDLVLGNFNTSVDIEGQITQVGLKVEGPFTVALINIHYDKENGEDIHMPFVVDVSIKNYLIGGLSNNGVLCVDKGDYFLLITNHSTERITNIIEMVQKNMMKKHNVDLICVIGNQYSGYHNLPKSYEECQVLITHIPKDKAGIFQFDETVLELTLDQLPAIYKEHLASKVFRECTKNEIDDFSLLIELYFENDGSLDQLAQKMFVHKNTVQYKIKKILKKTGLDIRIYHDLFVLYTAAKYKDNLPDIYPLNQ